MPLLVLWHFWGCFASFALLCGSKDTRPYFEDGEFREKAYFGRDIDGWGWFLSTVMSYPIFHKLILVQLSHCPNLLRNIMF